MPPEQRFVPRFAAEPPQEELPYGRWEERLARGVPRARSRSSTPAPRIWASRARSSGTPTARGTGARTCRRRRSTSGGYELFGYVRFLPRRRRTASRATSSPSSTSPTRPPSAIPDWQLDLCDEVIGTLARRVGRGRRDDARVGAPARLGRARSRRPSWPSLAVDQCELRDERFTLIAPDDYRQDLLEIKLFDVQRARAGERVAVRAEDDAARTTRRADDAADQD